MSDNNNLPEKYKPASIERVGKLIEIGNKLSNINLPYELVISLGHNNEINSVCFSHDGKYILSGSDDCTMKLWDKHTGKEIRTYKTDKWVSDVVGQVCFSPDGKYAISASPRDYFIKLWGIETGKIIRTFDTDGGRIIVCFSFDGKYVILGDFYGIMELYEVETGKKIRTFRGHKSAILSVSFLTDGKHALSGCCDNTIKLWEIETGKEIKTFTVSTDRTDMNEYDYYFTDAEFKVNSICFSFDGKFALSGGMIVK